jgi:hypothetical protein
MSFSEVGLVSCAPNLWWVHGLFHKVLCQTSLTIFAVYTLSWECKVASTVYNFSPCAATFILIWNLGNSWGFRVYCPKDWKKLCMSLSLQAASAPFALGLRRLMGITVSPLVIPTSFIYLKIWCILDVHTKEYEHFKLYRALDTFGAWCGKTWTTTVLSHWWLLI